MNAADHLPLKFVAAGIVSGLLCWLGGLLAPENSLLIKVYPGLIFGIVLYAVGRHAALAPPRTPGATFAIIVGAAVIAWRAAVDIGYMHGRPWPMLAAGALGALILSLGLMWAWRWPRSMALAIVATGALVAQGVQWLWDAYPAMDDMFEVSVLFVGWQALVMLAIAFTAPAALRASR